MDYEQLKKALQDYFGDMSRTAAETKEGLLDIAAEAEMLASSIPDDE